MIWLVLGLVLFLGAHSVRIFADPWRAATIGRLGAGGWKGGYTAVSIIGFVLIVVGFGAARLQPVVLWVPPVWTRHLAALLNLVAMVLLVAAYVPGNHIKARLQHPMILGVKVWAVAHLLSNQTLAEAVLFGAFLVWAVLDLRSARRRGATGTARAPALGSTVVTVVIGVALWAFIAFWAHAAWIGVKPFGA